MTIIDTPSPSTMTSTERLPAPVPARRTPLAACPAPVGLELADTVALHVIEHRPNLQEVRIGERPIGFLEHTGDVWVALSGAVYDWATEVGQHRLRGRAVLSLIANDPGTP